MSIDKTSKAKNQLLKKVKVEKPRAKVVIEKIDNLKQELGDLATVKFNY